MNCCNNAPAGEPKSSEGHFGGHDWCVKGLLAVSEATYVWAGFRQLLETADTIAAPPSSARTAAESTLIAAEAALAPQRCNYIGDRGYF